MIRVYDAAGNSTLAEIGKVRMPTGEGDALKIVLANLSAYSARGNSRMALCPRILPSIAALHRELARLSANRSYFLSRDAASSSEFKQRLNKYIQPGTSSAWGG